VFFFWRTVVLLVFGMWFDRRRERRRRDRWIRDTFGTDILPVDRLRIERLYFPPRLGFLRAVGAALWSKLAHHQ
jgi:hypothetical protein